jgi:hypothetical protein
MDFGGVLERFNFLISLTLAGEVILETLFDFLGVSENEGVWLLSFPREIFATFADFNSEEGAVEEFGFLKEEFC